MTPRELTDQAQRDGATLERARILGVAATATDAEELATALRAYHEGSERGELRRLLIRLWGPSPAVSDLRGLAARESAPAHTGVAATWCPICGDCRCAYEHGFADLGRTRDDPTCPLHGPPHNEQ